MSSHTTAANNLSEPSERGTLGLTYRKSVLALQNVFGWKDTTIADDGEREPLISGQQNGNADDTQGQVAGTSYGSVLDLPPHRRVPKPKAVKSPVRVEAKVWFANERTWISWLRVSLLIGSFSLAMFNSASHFRPHTTNPTPPDGNGEPGPQIPSTSPNGSTIRFFAIVYALISILTLSWGLFNYHRRLYLIKTKYAGNFSDMFGPPAICLALFVAVLTNFIVRGKLPGEVTAKEDQRLY
ncbi:hypothetical protein CBS101457_004019 [Exobasidium rhododendri]|nr:hypothetical protein CBS101457_004019 [Exobasidium rhododendri]